MTNNQVPITHDSPEWKAIVKHVYDNKAAIEAGVMGFEVLKPVLEFFGRNNVKG